MKSIKIILLSLLYFLVSSCEVTEELIKIIETETPLTEQEVIQGLKEALTISADTAVSIVSIKDGFFKDQLIKITFPEEADFILENKEHPLLKAIGINQLIDDAILSMNRAAENAAKEASPIFVNAIKAMTIKDAFNILNGNDTAATQYLRESTYVKLKSAFKPKVKNSLDKPLVSGVSANEAWYTLTSGYNEVAKLVPSLNTVNTALDDHVTQQALNGLFIKLAEEEKQIRKDPAARVTDILKRVFGNNNK